MFLLMCVVVVTLVPGWTSLIYASCNGHLPVVKHLVEHKANIEAKPKHGMFLCSVTAVLSCLYVYRYVCLWMMMYIIYVVLFSGWTSLIIASREGYLPVVKHLIEHKASIEAKENDGTFMNSSRAVMDAEVCG